MTSIYLFEQRNSPLLVSVPHDGRQLAPGMKERMTEIGRTLPDTDWHVRKLYEFVSELDASILSARFSRYVIDLNRPRSDARLYEGHQASGLCPLQTFAGAPLYKQGKSYDVAERHERIQKYWIPYHSKLQEELSRIRQEFGYALLWDAHSIQSRVPSLFEGVLPDLNLGTNDGSSCSCRLQDAVHQIGLRSRFTTALNGRFKGGYITRAYGDPKRDVHAIQLELAQCKYMDEDSFLYDETAANGLIEVIQEMLEEFKSTVM